MKCNMIETGENGPYSERSTYIEYTWHILYFKLSLLSLKMAPIELMNDHELKKIT